MLFTKTPPTSSAIQVTRLPDIHKPHTISLTSADWLDIIDADPVFAGILSEFNITQEYFYSVDGQETIDDVNASISSGTCDVQSNYAGALHFYNPAITVNKLAQELQIALPKLIQHLAKKRPPRSRAVYR